MALGLVAIILFSANLMAMVARHFWPNMPIIGEPRTEEVVVESVHHAPHVVWEVQTDQLERDLRRLERRIARERASLDATATRHIILNDTGNKLEIRLQRQAQEVSEAKVAMNIATRIASDVVSKVETPRVVIRSQRN